MAFILYHGTYITGVLVKLLGVRAIFSFSLVLWSADCKDIQIFFFLLNPSLGSQVYCG